MTFVCGAIPSAPLEPPPTGPAAPQLGYGPVQGSHTSSLSRLDVSPAHHGLEWAPPGTVGDVPSPYGEVGARGDADANASNASVATGPGWLIWVRVRTPWAISRPVRHFTDRLGTAVVTSLADCARLFCQRARDRPGLDVHRVFGARDLFSLRAGGQYDNSTTACVRVHGRAGLGQRQVPQNAEEPQKGPSGTG